jgi:hypothetical protein
MTSGEIEEETKDEEFILNDKVVQRTPGSNLNKMVVAR